VFTNMARDFRTSPASSDINLTSESKRKYLADLKTLSFEFLNALEIENSDLNDIGKLLHESWSLKKSLNHQTSNPYIDQLYETLKKKGMTGGKILGAGGGGFLLAFAKDPKLKEKIKYELYPNFIALDVKFSSKGTEILWKNF
ncbi:MAG: hypothetical protein ABI792_00120, partial [bacterium]